MTRILERIAVVVVLALVSTAALTPASRRRGGDARFAEIEARLRSLEQRYSDLASAMARREQQAHRVSVPFEVADESGKTIFSINADPRGFTMFL